MSTTTTTMFKAGITLEVFAVLAFAGCIIAACFCLWLPTAGCMVASLYLHHVSDKLLDSVIKSMSIEDGQGE